MLETEGAGILNLKYSKLLIFASKILNLNIVGNSFSFLNVDYLEDFCVEISDFCLPKKAPELSREVSLWVSGFLERKNQFRIFLAPVFQNLGVQKSDFWRPSAATLNLKFVAVSLK